MKLINEKKLILRVKTNVAAPAPGKINDRSNSGHDRIQKMSSRNVKYQQSSVFVVSLSNYYKRMLKSEIASAKVMYQKVQDF